MLDKTSDIAIAAESWLAEFEAAWPRTMTAR